MSEILDVSVEQRGGVVVARLAGELDLAGAPQIGDRLAAAVPSSAQGLVLDFTPLHFIDSSGVAMLFNLSRRLGSRRQALRVVVPPGGAVARVLELVEFGRAAAVDSDVDRAVAALAADGA